MNSRHFTYVEFACKCGCGFDSVDARLIDALEDVRVHFGRAVRITSGCRCPAHNAHVGGSPRSQHLYGKAADFVVSGVHADAVARYLEAAYPWTAGIGRYTGRTHFDVRTSKARWDYRHKG